MGRPCGAAPAATSIFNEDEDLLDDEDEDDSEDESASSAADRVIPSSAVLRVDQDHHHPQIVASKKPAQPDESRKLFQRLWTDEDEIELVKGFLEYTTLRGSTSHHHHDTTAFYDQIKSKFQLAFNKNQLVEKLRRLKKKYHNVINKFDSSKDYAFKSPHEAATFEISSKIWGNAGVNFNGTSTFRAFPAPINDDDDEPHNPHFAECQSPNLNGIDVNSKTPMSRKRNRAGAVKLEEKQYQPMNSNTINSQPSVHVTPIAAPVMGMGISWSLSNVIAEAVKSCLWPVLKELLGNSANYKPIHSGLGFGFTLSPLPLGYTGGMSGDKMADHKWRKQQMFELEVFSKRLELVRDQIKEQLQELRSFGN